MISITRNQRGNTTLVGILTSLAAASLFMISFNNIKLTNYEIKKRTQTFLCFKYLITTTDKYIYTMGTTNEAILVLNAAKLIPATSQMAETTQKLIKSYQVYTHLSYLKKISANKYCSFSQASMFIYNAPYQIAVREVDGTVKLRKPRWTNILTDKDIRTPTIFLKASYQLRNRFQHRATIKTTEPAAMASSLLKQSSG